MVDFLDTKEFAGVKQTMLDSGGDIEWKADFVEYVDLECDEEGKEFFYYMLPALRFMKEDGKHIAYTTPKKAICLFAPNKEIKTTMPNWFFIYLHECLHQLWDTFAAEDEVREQVGECDGWIMNIASDCVINEFIHTHRDFRLKFPSDGLVTAKKLFDNYGVSYIPSKDTQISLYFKLMEVAEKLRKNPPDPNDPPGPIKKESDEYVKGWNQAMEDYKAGKLKIN